MRQRLFLVFSLVACRCTLKCAYESVTAPVATWASRGPEARNVVVFLTRLPRAEPIPPALHLPDGLPPATKKGGEEEQEEEEEEEEEGEEEEGEEDGEEEGLASSSEAQPPSGHEG